MNSISQEPVFRPAKIGRASEDVALQIEAAILSGKIRMGERLPSERNLQVIFKSSRGVIREALLALKHKGLIEIRKGARGGAAVKNIELFHASEPMALFLKQQQVAPELLIEFRESMDRNITLLAITRGSSEDKRTLAAQAVDFEGIVGRKKPDLQKVAAVDQEMNILLAQMTGNPIFEMLMRTIQIGFSSLDQVLYEDPRYRMKTAANWRETARWIEAGEPFRALTCITRHYDLLRRCLAEREDDG